LTPDLVACEGCEVPVSRSDPRRATIIGIVGIILGVVMIAVVLIANNAGGDGGSTSPQRSQYDAGPAQARAARIAGDRAPIGFDDPAQNTHPIWLQHLGTDPGQGWFAFDASVNGCAVQWDRDAQQFVGCDGHRYPPDGTGLRSYPVEVNRSAHVIVTLNPDATTTTSSTSTTILVTGGS
jgi:hypothetical protein